MNFRTIPLWAAYVTCALTALAQPPLHFTAVPTKQTHPDQSRANQIRINEIQVIGTHNSYHAGLTPAMRALLEKTKPSAAQSLDYHHSDLATQLSAGIRQIELDIFADSNGGRYTHPAGPAMEAAAGLTPDAPDTDPAMQQPGFKVMHTQDVDQHSTCTLFTDCLRAVRTWSQSHPGHLPIFILVETKQGAPLNVPHATTPEPFTAATFDALDAEIRSVFSADEIITPDTVRGDHATLNEVIRAGGWPTLDTARGKAIFLLDQRNMGTLYLQGHPALRGRVLFTNAEPGTPDAAFTEQNDGSEETIAALVRQGYLVRTRTDADTVEGRSGSTARRDHALASGAQLLSTDYPGNEPARWSDYFVSFPGGAIARCNPVLKPAGCVDSELDAAAPAH